MKFAHFSRLAAFAACVLTAHAQTPLLNQADSINRQQELERKLRDVGKPGTAEIDAPELFQGEMKDVGPQSILKMRPKRTLFEVVADSQFFYTSNQNLTEDATGTTLFVNTAQVSLAPSAWQTSAGAVAPRLGVRQQWFNYGLGDEPANKGELDFDQQTLFAEAKWAFRQDWTADVGAEWSRLINHLPTYTAYRQFYSEWTPRVAVTRAIPFSETRSLIFSWSVNYRLTDSAPQIPTAISGITRHANDRMDNTFLAAYTHVVGPKLTLQPYYRLLLTRCGSQAGRLDYLHNFGLSAYVTLHQNVSLRGFLAYEIRDSDTIGIEDYQKFDLGAGLSLNIRL